MAASFLAVASGDLDHDDVVALQQAAQPSAVGAGALDAYAIDRPEALEPVHDVVVSGPVGGELAHPELGTALVERRDHVGVAMGVDAAGDADRRVG